MHEQSIVASLLSTAIEEAKNNGARKIIRIRLVVGELTGIEKDSVTFYFGFMAKDTMANGASLEFTITKAQLRCRECDIIFPRENLEFNCPECKKKAVEIVGGREFYIENMEII